MPTCKILFFLLLALFILCGECDEFVKYGPVGGEVIMDCGVLEQYSDVEWKLNDIRIFKIIGRHGIRQKGTSHLSDRASVSGGTLKVSRLQTIDSGVYSCNSRKQYTLHVVSVFAKPGPDLVQSSSAELHCDITGHSSAEVQWQSPSNDKKDYKKQVIHLKPVTSNDGGQWTCLFKDLKLTLTLTVVAGLQTTAVKVNEGENITLPCSLPRSVSQRVVGGKWMADHLPTVSFPTLKNTEGKGLHWSGDNTSRVRFTSDKLSINYDVTLTNAQPSDEGKYVCTVEFEGGVKLTAETNLMVVAKPSGEGPPPPELSVVQDILWVDSPVLSGGLESETEPEEHNTEPSQQSKQLHHRQSGSSMPNQSATKKKQIPSSAAIRDELLELQRDVLQLQKIKLQLEIEKLKKGKENLLNNKLLQLQIEGKITVTSIDE